MKAIGRCIAVAGSCVVCASSSATVIFDLDTLINGSLPTGTAPFLRAEFQNQGIDTVRLTMTNLMPTSNFVDNWLFNVDLSAPLTFNYVSGVVALSATSGANFSNGGSNMKAGLFDVEFHYPSENSNPSRFHGGHTSVYVISGVGLTEGKFLSLSQPDGQHLGGYYSAAHVQGYGPGLSGSIGTVPEPVSGLLIMSIGFVAARKRRKA